jgi:YfiH family protein
MINLFFGTAADFPIGFKEPTFPAALKDLAQRLQIPQLTVSHQVHGSDGRVVTRLSHGSKPLINFKSHDGDYLIAHESGVGIAVLTADCLPLVFYAPDKNVIAVAHAGWRGSVAGIGPEVVNRLVKEFGVNAQQLKVWFGPAGKACCYQVQQDFVQTLEANNKNAPESFLEKRGGEIFFDNMALNKQQLVASGVNENNIDLTNNHCTICNQAYHSYRRATDKTAYKTQATIAWL